MGRNISIPEGDFINEVFEGIEKKIDSLMNSDLFSAVDRFTNGELKKQASVITNDIITPALDAVKEFSTKLGDSLTTDQKKLLKDEVNKLLREWNERGLGANLIGFKLVDSYPDISEASQGNLTSHEVMGWLVDRAWIPVSFYFIREKGTDNMYFTYYEGAMGATGDAGLLTNMLYEMSPQVLSVYTAQKTEKSFDKIKVNKPVQADEFISPGSGVGALTGNKWHTFKMGKSPDFKGGSYDDVTSLFVSSLSPFHGAYAKQKAMSILGASDQVKAVVDYANNLTSDLLAKTY